ncbi:MAG: transglutaminase family protein [Elusimicrobia bacterium]|nr:transglutaminase family protein [Elusimicrobiota bacterium]
MISRNKIKALIDLMDKEPELKPKLQATLARFIKEEPLQFKNVIEESFGADVPGYIRDIVLNIKREELLAHFKAYFEVKNPSLLKGFALIARFINPQLTQKAVLDQFELLHKSLSTYMDAGFDVFHKAEVMSQYFFINGGYRLESLSSGPKVVSLPDIISCGGASSFAMAALYCCCAECFDLKADMFDAGGKVMIRLRDKYSYEPVYVDIFAGGRFVGEDECSIYASARGFAWSGAFISPMSSKQVIKRFLANLIYVYSKSGDEAAVSILRKCFKFAA